MTLLVMLTRVVEKDVALSLFIWSHGTQMSMTISNFAKITVKKSTALAISFTRSGSQTSS